jgi:GT2 family glycosyltransferase
MNSLITLSVVSHGDSEKTSHLLSSLQKHEDTKRLQIILTDNLKKQLPDFNIKNWNSLHIIRNDKPKGFAENHNQAFQLATGKYFSILNPDLIFEQPIVETLINDLETQQMDLIAPKIVDAQNVIQDSFRGLPSPLKLIKRRLVGEQVESNQADAHGLIHPDWIAGMFWLMKSETYHQLGGMDEKFRLYFEDVDFCTRARLAGMKIAVDSKIQIRHDAQRSSRKKIYYLLLHTLSALKFFSSSIYWQALRKK